MKLLYRPFSIFFGQGVAIGTTKAMAGKLTAPFVSKVNPKTNCGEMPLCKTILVKVVAAGGGAAAGSIAGPLGTLGGAVVSWFPLP